ncbi:MAG: AI-2E family transporter [Bacteroidia bacterium]
MKSVYTIQQRRILILICTLLFGGFLLYALKGMFTAFLGASVLYVLFRPFLGFLVEKKKLPRWLSATIILVASFFILVVPFLTIGLMIANKINKFLEHKEALNSVLTQVQDFIGFSVSDEKFIDKVYTFLEENLLGGVNNILTGVGGLLLTIGMMYFFLYFMLTSYLIFEKGLNKYLPLSEKQIKLFSGELRNSTYSNVLGQGFIAFIQGALVSLGFWLFNYNDPVFWGIIAFFLSFMPVIGAPIVFVPAALIALAYGDSKEGYGLLLWGFLLVTNIDNVLRYFISKYLADTHPIITIVGVIIGIPIFGILGLVFGPLLISWFLLLVKIAEKSGAQLHEERVNDVSSDG